VPSKNIWETNTNAQCKISVYLQFTVWRRCNLSSIFQMFGIYFPNICPIIWNCKTIQFIFNPWLIALINRWYWLLTGPLTSLKVFDKNSITERLSNWLYSSHLETDKKAGVTSIFKTSFSKVSFSFSVSCFQTK